MRGQKRQRLELGAGEIDELAIGTVQRAADQIEGPAGELSPLRSGVARADADPHPTQQVLDARQQLALVKGLGDIVIGPDLEPRDAVDRVAPPGDENNADVRAGAKFAGQAQSVLAGKLDVDHQQVRGVSGNDVAHPVTIFGLTDAVALRLEIGRELGARHGIVLDDDDMGGRCLHWLVLTSFHKCRHSFHQVPPTASQAPDMVSPQRSNGRAADGNADQPPKHKRRNA